MYEALNSNSCLIDSDELKVCMCTTYSQNTYYNVLI